MNRYAKIATIGLMSALTFASAGLAAGTMTQVDKELSTMKNPRFNVIDLASVDKNDPAYNLYTRSGEANSPQVHSLQASIMANKTLSGELKRQAVEINNIVGAQQAADGTVTFYVR